MTEPVCRGPDVETWVSLATDPLWLAELHSRREGGWDDLRTVRGYLAIRSGGSLHMVFMVTARCTDQLTQFLSRVRRKESLNWSDFIKYELIIKLISLWPTLRSLLNQSYYSHSSGQYISQWISYLFFYFSLEDMLGEYFSQRGKIGYKKLWSSNKEYELRYMIKCRHKDR